jgi:hypothetical protein
MCGRPLHQAAQILGADLPLIPEFREAGRGREVAQHCLHPNPIHTAAAQPLEVAFGKRIDAAIQ